MKAKITLDGLRAELSRNLYRVEISIEAEPSGLRGEVYTIRVYAVPKLPFLREVLGTPRIGALEAIPRGDGIYEVDVWDLFRVLKYGAKEADDLDLKCKRLIERLRELVSEKEPER